MREPGTVERGVLFGRNDVLFLAEGAHRVLDFLLGVRRVPRESLDNFAANLAERAAKAATGGAKFLHLVFPDKQSVLVDDCPIREPFYLGAFYMDHDLSPHAFYPRQELIAAGRGTYLQTDTHASDRGIIAVTAAVVERLTGLSQTEARERLLGMAWHEDQRTGDMGGRFDPALSETRQWIQRSWINKWLHNNVIGGNNGIVDLLFNRDAVYPKRLLVFGDSFARDLSGFFCYFFKEVVFLRTPYFHDDIFDQIQPDYVVTENVERYLSFCYPDNLRPSFFTYPYLDNHQYAPSQEFAQAFSAVLSYGRPPYFDYLSANGLY